jgi:hypothetical protein
MAASWSAMVRSSRSETATGSPSAETTIAWATDGVCFAKLPMSQLRSRASALSCGMAFLGRRVCGAVEPFRRRAVGPLARMQAADQAAGLRPLVAGQHTADLVGKHDQFLNLAAAVPR